VYANFLGADAFKTRFARNKKYYTISVTRTSSPTATGTPCLSTIQIKKRVRSAILKFAIAFLNDTWGLFKKQTSISSLTGNAQSWLQRLMSFGKKTTSLLSQSHRTQHTEWSHCSAYIYCKCVWRLRTAYPFWRVCSLCLLLSKTRLSVCSVSVYA
jgi:hypothetical protein